MIGWRRSLCGPKIRLDRIFNENLTRGELRVIVDLFGPSIASAARYVSILDRAAPPAVVS